jgi:hypothetical protein
MANREFPKHFDGMRFYNPGAPNAGFPAQGSSNPFRTSLGRTLPTRTVLCWFQLSRLCHMSRQLFGNRFKELGSPVRPLNTDLAGWPSHGSENGRTCMGMIAARR